VIGWSDGGINGILLAIRHPEKVKKLAVTGANLWPDTSAVQPEVLAMVQPFYNNLFQKKEKTAAEKEQWKLLRILIEEPHISLEALHTIHAPTLVIGGDHDVIREEHTMVIYHNIPKSYLWIIPNSGHSTPIFQKEAFNKTVENFFTTPYRNIQKEGRFQ
jgi:pimeloyl-ACP methyl ester carboxylesterase